MTSALSQALQEACDDLYCAPLDVVAQANVRGLLVQTVASTDEREFAREVRMAVIALRHNPDINVWRVLLALLDPAFALARLDNQPNIAA